MTERSWALPKNEETLQAPPSIEEGVKARDNSTALSRSQDLVTPRLLRAPDVCALLGIKPRTLSKYTQNGAIPSHKLGSVRVYDLRELHAYIDAGCPTTPDAGEAIRKAVRDARA